MIIQLKSPGMKYSVLDRIHKLTITAENVADEKELVHVAAAISSWRKERRVQAPSESAPGEEK